MTVYLACYKGRRNGKWYQPKALAARLLDSLVRKVTHGPYSHCEIAVEISNGRYDCFTASLRDGGVRRKIMPLPPDKWDLIPVCAPDAALTTLKLYHQTAGAAYDHLGAIGAVLPIRQNRNKWFCSEWCAAALGLPEPQNHSPNSLAEKVKTSCKKKT